MKTKLPILLLLALLPSATASAGVIIDTTTVYQSGTTTVSSPTTIENTLNTSVTVQSGATVTYVAGTSITLRPGFHAVSGSSFTARIDPSLDPTDSDSDGIPDWWELQHGLNPNNPNDAATNAPNGKTYLLNFLLGINPAASPTTVTPGQLQLKVQQPNP